MQMTRNSNWSDLNWTLTDVTEGETIYWTTTASDGRIWYHKGQVETTSNVNRSQYICIDYRKESQLWEDAQLAPEF